MYLRGKMGVPLIYHYGLKTLEESYVPQYGERHYVILPKGTIVYNAKCTTDDEVVFNEKRYSSMIQLWKELTGEFWTECCNAYCSGTNDDIVGGHVVRKSKSPYLEKKDEVLIVPLCKKCNHYTNDGPIEMARDTKAVVLRWDD